MPVYRTSHDLTLDDLIAQIEAAGEHVIQVLMARDGNFTVVSRVPTNDTGRAWIPNKLGQTETRS